MLRFVLILFFFSLTLFVKNNSVVASSAKLETFKNKNPQSSKSGDATQSNSTLRPTLAEKSIGKLPALEFNGSNEYLNYDGSELVESNYTIFVVEKRTDAKANNYFLGSTNTGPSANQGLILGYKTETQILFGQGSNEELIAIESYNASASPILHVFVQDTENGKTYYRNGAEVFSNSSNISSLTSNSSTAIGRNDSNHYNGKIAEIAVFTRSLNSSEISEISTYMIDKWKIDRISDGTVCTTGSPGYVNIANGTWSNGGSASNDGSISITCTIGSIQGTIGPLLCKNGVYSGDTSGSCGYSSCSDSNPDTSFSLSNGGTWDTNPIVSLTHLGTVTATCPHGSTGGIPTLTCNDGVLNQSGGTCNATCLGHSISGAIGSGTISTSPSGSCHQYSGNGRWNYCCSDGRWTAGGNYSPTIPASNFINGFSPAGTQSSCNGDASYCP